MKKTGSTKRALLMSGLALLLCVAMLIGSTYAWFTDSVTSAGNKIQAGTLKLDLELYDAESKTWNSIKTSKAPIFNYDLWEPGYTAVQLFKVENEGTLALKWKAKFVSNNALTDLAKVIDVYVRPYGVQADASAVAFPADRNLDGYTGVGTLDGFINTMEETTFGDLKAGEAAYLGIALKMQESAGNDYQGMDLGGTFDIQIVANQLTYENDSFGNTYDEDADRESNITVASKDEIQKAFDDAKDGDVITLSGDVDVADGIVFDSDAAVTLDLGGHSLKGSDDVLLDVTDGNVTIQNGVIKNTKDGATETLTSVRLSGDAVATVKDVSIETTGIGVLVEDNAKITELNANVNSYVNANGTCDGSAIVLRGNARIDLISGGEYTSTYSDEFINAYTGSFSGVAIYPISINSASASIGEISGGTFLGRSDDGKNGATIFVNAGKIEKISGGYFGYCKTTMRNYPYYLITVNTANGASIDAITGGTFEYASGFGCDFENIVDNSGSKIEKRTNKATVTVKMSSSVKTKDVEIWDVVAK